MRVRDLFEKEGSNLQLTLLAGREGLSRKIEKPHVNRLGLQVAGCEIKDPSDAILILGEEEVNYLHRFSSHTLVQRMQQIVHLKPPAIIATSRGVFEKEFCNFCEKKRVPFFFSLSPLMELMSRLFFLLEEALSPKTTLMGTFLEVFGQGLLIQGEAAMGKSELALGLLKKGHRLVSDDVVSIQRRGWKTLIGTSFPLTRDHMEIRGIGLINVARLFGIKVVCPSKSLDLIINLEEWKKGHCYELTELNATYSSILGVKIPCYLLPLSPKRDPLLLIETLTLQFCMQQMGIHTAKELDAKLQTLLQQKKNKRVDLENCAASQN